MIERISGKIIEKSPTFCVLDCHGVGVGLHISLNTFQYLEGADGAEPVLLHSYLHVREDALKLYGFATVAEKQLFQLLLSISGVGPKLAIAILSGSSADELRAAIIHEDVARLTRIPGVGKKTAQRVILELKEKINKQSAVEKIAALIPGAPRQHQKINEAMQALMELGYKQHNARQAVEKILKHGDDNLSLEELVVSALKEL